MRLLSAVLVLAASAALAEEPPVPGLPEGAVRLLGSSDGAHPVDIVDTAFTPDGKLVLSIDGDGAVRAWDIPSLHLRFSLDLEEQGHFLCVSPTGGLLAVGQLNGILLFSLPDGKPAGRFYGPPATLLLGAFSPDGKRFAATDEEGGLDVWDAEARSFLFGTKEAHGGAGVDGIFWAGGSVVTWADNGAVKVWDAAAGKELRTINTNVDSSDGISLSPDGKRLVVAVDGEGAKCWDLESGEEKEALLPAESAVASPVVFSPDGSRAAWWTYQNEVIVCSMKDREVLTRIPMRTGGTPRFSPDGEWILSGVGSCRLVLYHTESGKRASEATGHDGAISSLEFDDAGKVLFSAGIDGKVLAWDLSTGASRQVADNGSALCGAALVEGGAKLMTCTSMGGLSVWDVSAGKRVRETAERPGTIDSLAWASDAGIVFAVWQDGRAEVWDASVSSPVASLEDLPPLSGRHAAIRGDGRLLALSGKEGITLFDARTGDRRALMETPGHESKRLAFSPNGALLAFEDNDSRCIVMETASGIQVAEMPSNSGGDGIAFATGDRLVHVHESDLTIVDLATMQQIGPARTLPAPPVALAVSADGRFAATAFPDGTILVWDLPAAPAAGKPPDAATLWEELGKGPEPAYHAVMCCASADSDAVKALADGLAVVPPVPDGVTAALAKLGSEDAEERDSAENILRAAGGEAEPALRAALKDAPPETRIRIEAVLASGELPPLTSPPLLRRARAVEALERCGSPGARAALKTVVMTSPYERERRMAEDALKRLAKR